MAESSPGERQVCSDSQAATDMNPLPNAGETGIDTLIQLASQALGGIAVSLTITTPDATQQWIGDGHPTLDDACRQRLVAAIESHDFNGEPARPGDVRARAATDVLYLGEDRPVLRWLAVRVTSHGALIACEEEPWEPDDACIELLLGFAGLVERELDRLLDQHTAIEYDVDDSPERSLARTVASASRDGVIGLTPDGQVSFANPTAARLLDIPANDLVGRSFLDWFRPSSASGQSVSRELSDHLRAGTSVELDEAQLVRPGGETIPVELAFVPNLDPDGKVIGGVLRFADLRARQAALLAARHSEARHQTFLEMTLDSIVTVDDAGTILEFNRAAERTFRCSADDVLGRELTDVLIPQPWRDWYRSAFHAFAATGDGPLEGQRVRIAGQRQDGTTFPAEVSITRLPNGNASILTLYFHDLTDRTWSERRRMTRYTVTRILAETESPDEAIPNIMEAICNGLEWDWAACWARAPGSTEMRIELTWRREGIEAGALEIASRQHSFNPGHAFLGEVWTRRRAGWVEDIEQHETFMRKDAARACGFRSVAAMPVLGRNEVIGIIEFHSQQRREPDDELLRLLDSLGSQVGQFIERKQVEEERVQLLQREQVARADAEAAERRLSFLAEASAQLASSLDYEATLANVARLAVPKLADYCAIDMLSDDGTIRSLEIADIDPQKEAIGRELQAANPVDPESDNPVAQVMRTGRPLLFQEVDDDVLRLFDPSGGEYFKILRALGNDSAMYVPLIARGRTIGVISFVSAESGYQYGSSDLALAQELARRAAIAIDNARLYREAQDAVRVREEFLSIASHELKTPLTTVKGYGQLISRLLQRSSIDRSRIRHLVDQLQEQLGRFEVLIADLLDISRIQQGRLELRTEIVDMVALVHNVIDRFDNPAETNPIHRIRVECPDRVEGRWDPGRMDQVLTNLISNAVKYSPDGGEIVVRVALDSADWVRVSIDDPGIGIPEEDQARLFRPFARSEHVHRAISGVGLGLYITRQIVERHGGTIEIESEVGVGSKFTVILPRCSSGDPVVGDSTAS
jgi:PAS domain S-box-containing protein